MDHHIYKKVENYVTGLYDSSRDDTLAFHSLQHTQTVVARTKEIAGHYDLSEKEMIILFISAWFHDTGHLFTDPARHEEMSVEIMRKFMQPETDDSELLNEIEKTILSTKPPRNPTTLLQQIICDADTYHLGTKDFKASNKAAMDEHKLKTGKLDKTEFDRDTISMLQSHQYYTKYCRELLSKRKIQNMKKLKHKLDEPREEKAEKIEATEFSEGDRLAGIPKDKSGLMSKGIQTMLRLTSENHLKLSDMADHKANILISVNSIIISVILSVLLRKLQSDAYLVLPTIIFLLVAVTTIVVSIMATRPKVSMGTFSDQDVLDKKTNLLFFGNFHRVSFEKYEVAMRKMMVDTDYLYGSLIKDIYSLGTVLGRKYKLIRLAYNIFMIGIIVSVIAFAVAVYFYHGAPASSSATQGMASPL